MHVVIAKKKESMTIEVKASKQRVRYAGVGRSTLFRDKRRQRVRQKVWLAD